MTVAQLIKELQKYPRDSKVGVRHHDNLEDEISGTVKAVRRFDPDESFDPKFCKGVYVVLNC